MNHDAIIARCAKVAKKEAEKFINPYSAALIADAITARAADIKDEDNKEFWDFTMSIGR